MVTVSAGAGVRSPEMGILEVCSLQSGFSFQETVRMKLLRILLQQP